MDRIKIGVLGLGRGLTHLRNLLSLENVEVIGGAERLDLVRERASERIAPQQVEIYREYEELLERGPDAVVVASNGRLQAAHAIQALEAGCHVLSEVPGAMTEEELRRIAAAVEQTGRLYMLAENSCYLDFLRYWRRWVTERRLGPIPLAEGEYVHYLPKTLIDPAGNRYSPSEVRAQGITQTQPVWRADQPPIQYLSHDLGPLLEVLDDRVVSVCCRSAPFWCREAPLRSDGQFALFETARGTLIRILVSLSTRRPGAHNYRLLGVEGSAEWFSYEGFCRLFDRDREEADGWARIEIGDSPAGADKTTGHGGTDSRMIQSFVRAVIEGREMPIDVYRLCDFTLPGILANRSADLGGQPIAIPDMRPGPFTGTRFWEHVPLPDSDPPAEPYVSLSANTM